MKRALHIFFGILILMMTASCKKEKKEEPAEEEVVVPEYINGIFTIIDSIRIENDTVLVPVNTVATAFFMHIKSGVVTATQVNSVTLNGIPLTYLNDIYYLPNCTVTPSTWEVKGNMAITDFKHTHKKVMPNFPNYKTLPSSINQKKDLFIPMSGFANVDFIRASIRDGNSKRIYYGGDFNSLTSITFTYSSLSGLQPGSDVLLEFRMDSSELKWLGGQKFQFINQTFLTKKVTLY